ncbi:MAG: OmpH family outer membrane protein [Chitinophagaceae bacterium]
MKKLKFLAIAICLIASTASNAQAKIGYIDAETMLYLMPEVPKIDSLVRLYQVDTVGKEYNSLLEQYRYKDSIYNDSAHPLPVSVKKQYEKDIADLRQTLTNWQQIAQQATQEKQNTLLAPVMKRLNDAIAAVAKEKGYTYVLSRESILIGPDADNMLPAVAKKLSVTLPPQLQPGYKPPVGGLNAGN